MMDDKIENTLKYEKSPYLLQHSGNPVNWMPWGEEAFRLARKEDKPIFLSIGYSTCHWCHVMEKESFEDMDVADLMNKTFVNIKVDREERPDIDKIYMSVAQMMTGRGGWPLTIIMTPSKEPFFAATYIPKENRGGQTGLIQLIPLMDKLWKTKRKDILASKDKIKDLLMGIADNTSESPIDHSLIEKAYNGFYSIYDRENGGFGNAPKFPSAHNLSFLLNYWKKSGNPDSLEMVEKTLSSMRNGGIWDHIGYGFHRYSTDKKWILPHFEKMLYDQAINAFAYLDAYQVTGKDIYKETVMRIYDYVNDNMRSPQGAFYSAEDADSEGEEGTFYVWDSTEITDLLGEEDGSIIEKVFNIKKNGNFRDEATGLESGKNILFRTKTYAELAKEMEIDSDAFTKKIDDLMAKLYIYRKNRISPFKDDKVLTDWNGLMAAAYARGGRVLDDPELIKIAEDSIAFITSNMTNGDDGLFHRYREGQSSINANLDDYAFMVLALIELYQSTFKFEYINKALKLQEYLDKYFWDDKNGGYFFTDSRSEELIVRQKESYDGAIPSGNSVSAFNLVRLGRITMNAEFEKKATRIGEVFGKNIKNSPVSHTYLLSVIDYLSGPSYEIIIVDGEKKEESRELFEIINKHFIPNKIVIYKSEAQDFNQVRELKAFINELHPVNNKPTAYICKNYYCELPVTNKEDLMKSLNILGHAPRK